MDAITDRLRPQLCAGHMGGVHHDAVKAHPRRNQFRQYAVIIAATQSTAQAATGRGGPSRDGSDS